MIDYKTIGRIHERLIVLGILLFVLNPLEAQIASNDTPYLTFSGNVIDAQTKEPVDALIRYESVPYGSTIGVIRGSKIHFPMDVEKDYVLTVTAEGYASYVTTIKILNNKDNELFETIELIPINRKGTIRLEKLIFAQGRAEITDESYDELDKLAEMLQLNQSMEIQLEGHTDFRGNEHENMRLSQKRVKAVRDYLISKGVDKNRIKTKAFGGEQPITRDSDDEARRKNRRVEVRILSN